MKNLLNKNSLKELIHKILKTKTEPRTTTSMLTQDERNNVKLIQKVMTKEKEASLSLRNQD